MRVNQVILRSQPPKRTNHAPHKRDPKRRTHLVSSHPAMHLEPLDHLVRGQPLNLSCDHMNGMPAFDQHSPLRSACRSAPLERG